MMKSKFESLRNQSIIKGSTFKRLGKDFTFSSSFFLFSFKKEEKNTLS